MFEMLKAIGRAILPKKAGNAPIDGPIAHVPQPPVPSKKLVNGGIDAPALTDAQYEKLNKDIEELYTGRAGGPVNVTEGAPDDVRLKIKLTKKGDKLVLDLNDLMDETGAKSVNIRFNGNNITLGGNNSSVVIGSGNVFSGSCSVGGSDYMKVGDNIEMDGDYMRVGNITMGRKKRNR